MHIRESTRTADRRGRGGRHRGRVAPARGGARGVARAPARRRERRLGLHGGPALGEAREKEPARDGPGHRGPPAGKRHDRVGGHRRPRLHQYPPGPGRSAERCRPGACREGRLRQERGAGRRAQDQPRVHLRQPHRPDARGPWPLGGARRRHGARHAPRRLRRVRGVLHQRPRHPDGQLRRVGGRALPAAARPRRGNARELLRRRVREGHRPGHHRRGRRPVARRRPDRAHGELPRARLRLRAGRTAPRDRTLRHHVRLLVFRAQPLRARRERAERRRPQPQGHGRERLHLRAGRRHLVQVQRVRRREGPRAHQGQRRDDLLHERRGVPLQQDGARLRPSHQHLGRRPPRLHRALRGRCWPRGAGPARWRSCSASW